MKDKWFFQSVTIMGLLAFIAIVIIGVVQGEMDSATATDRLISAIEKIVVGVAGIGFRRAKGDIKFLP